MQKRTLGMLVAGILVGITANRSIRRVKSPEIGPCGPALDDWGWEMKRLIDEYNAAHPDATLTGPDAYKHFLDVNPYPTAIKSKRRK